MTMMNRLSVGGGCLFYTPIFNRLHTPNVLGIIGDQRSGSLVGDHTPTHGKKAKGGFDRGYDWSFVEIDITEQ